MKIRCHHLLCLTLFGGAGYNENFKENITRVATLLRNKPSKIFTVCSHSDEVCKACPNLKEDKTCKLGNPMIIRTDQEVIKGLSLKENSQYTYLELMKRLSNLTEEDFINICGKCGWYKRGLCRYEDFIRNVNLYVNQHKWGHYE